MQKGICNKIELKCRTCNAPIWKWESQIDAGEGKYCSRSCYYKAKLGKPSPKKDMVRRICPICKDTKDTRSELCRKCWGKKMGLLQLGERNHSWRGGISFEPYPIGWTNTFREQIRYRDGYTCQVCGVPEIECKRKLCVHHIDYDKKNISEANLVCLCLSCHQRTNYHRTEWEDYFVRCRKTYNESR